jgi:hypothetical protein
MLFSIGIDWYGQVKKKLEKGYFEDDMLKEKRNHIARWLYFVQIMSRWHPTSMFNNI